MDLKPISFYARALKPELPEHFFRPVPRRLLWLPLHLGVIVGLGAWVHLTHPHWALQLLAAVVMGHSVGCFGFLGHEIMHGHIVKTEWLKRALGQLCFSPYLLVVEFWHLWHNRQHHGHTQVQGRDPDLMPGIEEYQANPGLRFTSRFMVGWRNPLTFLILSFGFISHQSTVLFTKAVDMGVLTPAQRRRCLVKYALITAFWLSLLPVLGIAHFALLVLLPIGLGNILVMSYIMTNHNLNPRTPVNDPLVNSLTVTTPAPLAALHMNFGYHVTHHIFPSMSPAYAPQVAPLIREKWGQRYQSLPLPKALWLLMVTPRIYEDDFVLVDPANGRRFVTLGARQLGARAAYLDYLPFAREMAEELLDYKPWTVANARVAAWEALERQSERMQQARLNASEYVAMQSMKLALARETARTMVRLQKEKVREQKRKFREAKRALKSQLVVSGQDKWQEKLQAARESLQHQKEVLAQVRETARELVRQQKAQFYAARHLANA